MIAAGELAAGPSAGLGAVTALDGPIWLAAAGAGLSLRLLDARARATAEQVGRDERLELARELHDVVAHHITGMLLQAQGAQVVARRDPEQVGAYLAEMETAGTDALAAMRRVVGLLRDTGDAPPASPGPERLGTLVERFRRQGPMVRLDMPDGDTGWPPEVTTTVHRVVQEALTNVLRHAPKARSVEVTVGRDDRDVTVEVADDAPAAPSRHRGGYGLIGMRERVETLGGTLHAGPRPGGGWSVRATLPAGEPR
ncbi:sensor histidine kinase [Actinomadura sp. CNU-125]|uniref:sensor histidine kinase n=1 Tax=Actinomadura sp. CNU-125 TaxID=1904961 RepID=UPI0021CCFE6A|nr:sensor histidine kinase [Actinomadura sp. CNU-125]